jgi:MtfA peptidase
VNAGGPSAFAAAVAVLLAAAGFTLGTLARGAVLDGLLAATAAGGIGHHLLTRRPRRRRLLLASPFPDEWRRFLVRRYAHYRRLPEAERRRFEDDLRLFLDETRITGVEVESSEELRLLVAASAVTLCLGWPAFEWHSLVTEVLLYPQSFDRDFSFEKEELSGLADPWGTVILSAPSLRHSFSHPDDGYHVGLHEFAHLLDMEMGHFDGIPAGVAAGRVAEWQRLAEEEIERVRDGRSALDPYGGENPAEFLAVSVEAFFELPLELRRRHAALYALLRDWLAQDPALWEELMLAGSRLPS